MSDRTRLGAGMGPVMPGRHRRSSARRRRATVALAGLGAVVVGVVGFALVRGDGVERVCTRPEDLRAYRNVRLIPDAMAAFRAAEAASGMRIEVVHSFRSCREQARACEGICGSRRGCPGTCAPPGYSWHQRAAAIDVTQEMLDTPGVVESLEDAGWCQSLPASDAGHFSFGGCH